MTAYSQTDLKRLVAYTSVSHLGFVLLGIFSWNPLALQGAVMTMISHGLSTGAIFVLVGSYRSDPYPRSRPHGRSLGHNAKLSGSALFFSLASLGCRASAISWASSSYGRILSSQYHNHGGGEFGVSPRHSTRCAWYSVPFSDRIRMRGKCPT